MQERAHARSLNFTQYVNIDENEVRYRDYYETDNDSEDDLIAEQDDYERLLASGIFNFKNYDFVEESTENSVLAVESVFEKKIFKFKHRKWNDDPANHFIRENRMIRRFLDRLKNRDPDIEVGIPDPKEISAEYTGKYLKYQDYVLNEAVQQYKDYYESDTEDIKDFEHITPEEKQEFSKVFKDYAKPLGEFKTIISVPTRKYDNDKSLIANLREHYSDLRTRVIPSLNQQVKDVSKHQYSLSSAKDFQLASGTYEFEVVKGFEDIFVDHQLELEYLADSPEPKAAADSLNQKTSVDSSSPKISVDPPKPKTSVNPFNPKH
jgi:hypothetical protein